MDEVGTLPDLFKCKTGSHDQLNLISLDMMGKRYEVQYVPRKSYTFNVTGRPVVFKHRGGLYKIYLVRLLHMCAGNVTTTQQRGLDEPSEFVKIVAT